MTREVMSRAVSPDNVALRILDHRMALRSAKQYPMTGWQRDPVGYVYERLKVPVLAPYQEDILRAVCAAVWHEAPSGVAVRSAQKIGKSACAVFCALWFYECFPDARVFVTAAIEAQTKAVLWRELGRFIRMAAARGVVVDGVLSKNPEGGLVSSDGSREIKGVGSGSSIEALAGLSGRMLFIVDEASALLQDRHEVFMGNCLGGGTLLYISNPTNGSGPFFEAFHSERQKWTTFGISALDVLSWKEETGIEIEGTIGRREVEEAREVYGEDSVFWIVRVLGDFVRNESGRAWPLVVIEGSAGRWLTEPDEGPLVIGLDPAGPGDKGDESVWAFVRGSRCAPFHVRKGLGARALVDETMALMKLNRRPGEVPEIHVDCEGLGSEVEGFMRAEREHRDLHDRANRFLFVAIRTSSPHVRDIKRFQRVRDEMLWECALWTTTGAIPHDDKLHDEMYHYQWFSLPDGRIKATPKKEIREQLGRSSDRLDALSLAVYRRTVHEDVANEAPKKDKHYLDAYEHEVRRGRGLDPFSSGNGFKR